VNRISFGVQSFHDDELSALDRIHSAEEAKEAYLWARAAGLERINLDLIYGLPEQEMDRWQATLEEAIALAPEHLSLYALTVEEGTKLAHDIEHERVPGPDGDTQAEMYEWSCERLAAANYGQYDLELVPSGWRSASTTWCTGGIGSGWGWGRERIRTWAEGRMEGGRWDTSCPPGRVFAGSTLSA
jgi:oxygen-independent coproporphyrinogen-3 oxidase